MVCRKILLEPTTLGYFGPIKNKDHNCFPARELVTSTFLLPCPSIVCHISLLLVMISQYLSVIFPDFYP